MVNSLANDALFFGGGLMEIVKMKAGEITGDTVTHLSNILEDGGVICLPCNGKYRLLADVTNQDAVMRLMQSKRRVKKAPSLVFIDHYSKLHLVTNRVDPVASALMKSFWPGPLTILFDANPDLPRKVVKELTKANGRIGVRVPQSGLCRQVVEAFGGPVLVSSANRGRRAGATSPAQVRQNFLGRIDYFVDAGDLTQGPKSTVIDVENNGIEMVREGAVSAEKLDEVARSAAN